MIAFLYIRGQQAPIEITYKDGLDVKNMLDSDRPFSTIVSLSGASWKLSEIKGVSFEQETQDNKEFNKTIKEERLYRVEFLNWMPRSKAKESISHFKLFYFVQTGKDPDNITKEKALARIEEFFKDNQTWATPSLKIYEKMIPEVNDDKYSDFGRRIFTQALKALEDTEFNELKINKFEKPIIN